MGKLIDLVNEMRRKAGWQLIAPSQSSAKGTSNSGPSDLALQWLYAWTILKYPEPVAEYRFDPDRQWRFDFAWVESCVACEIHGGIWSQGRHTRGDGFAGDREKVARAQELGWLVYEVTNVKDARLMDRIAGQIEVRTPRPCGRGGK